MKNRDIINLFNAHCIIARHTFVGEVGKIGATKLAIARNLRLLEDAGKDIDSAMDAVRSTVPLDSPDLPVATNKIMVQEYVDPPQLRRLDYVMLNFGGNETVPEVLAVLLPILDNLPE